jgi:hypothetical protein
MYSDLYHATTKYFKEKGVMVNCTYDGVGQSTEFAAGEKESYRARLFTSSGVREWDSFSVEMLKGEGFRKEIDDALSGRGVEEEMEKVEILVCTHGSRDCRCSDRGGALVHSLRDDIKMRGWGDQIEISEIAHVGGHK